MTDLLVTGGQVLTQDEERTVHEDGAVAITDNRIEAVGPSAAVTSDASRVIDVDGSVVMPGLVNSHTHVADILLRGVGATDRDLYDWLFNIKQPGTVAMTPEEHALASTLYSLEALEAGVTTFVENATEVRWGSLDTTEAKLDAYDRLGIRAIYGAGIHDRPADEAFLSHWADITARGPDAPLVDPDEFTVETETALDGVERLIERRHDPDNRLSVWPAPVLVEGTTTEGLQGAYEIAKRHDVMTTTHVAEAEVQERGPLSSVEYLHNIGYLGERALLGHCVQVTDRDVRLLARTNTRVAHNLRANMRLATGFAPVVPMLEQGITIGIGTDNPMLGDAVNLLSDAQAVASVHKGHTRDPGVLPAQQAFDMVTCDAAEAIGRPDLGSLEVGNRADVVVVDTTRPSLTPSPDPIHALVYGACGSEIETVVCGGEILVEHGTIETLERQRSAVLAEAEAVAQDIVERVGLA